MTIYELQNILSQYSLFVLAALLFVEYLSLPGFPRGIVLPLMGILSGLGVFGLRQGAIAAFAAATAAALAVYLVGYSFPKPAMRFYSSRQKGVERFQQVEKFLKRYGRLALVRCRFHPVFRTFVSIPAGVLRMNFVGYLASTLVGNALFVALVMGAAHLVTALLV